MAPRKTTRTAAEPAPNTEAVEAPAEVGKTETLTLDIRCAVDEAYNLEMRFQVALAVFPVLIGMGIQPVGDENEAGAAAAEAFAYADAFIAQSKKVGNDGDV